MILGGIPYCLDMLEKGLPFSRNIGGLFFRQGAPLGTEYDFLFRSLLGSAVMYRQVAEALASKNKGLSLKEIKDATNIGGSGGLSEVLGGLCKCDFVRKYSAYGKKEKISSSSANRQVRMNTSGQTSGSRHAMFWNVKM